MTITFKHENNEKNGKFLIVEDNNLAGEINYIWERTDVFIINHTKVYESFNGKGYAKQLAMQCVDYARKNNMKIIPQCTYIKLLFDKDKDILDVLYSTS